MVLTVWAELSTKGSRASISVTVPDEDVIGDDGAVDAERAEALAKEYLGNIMQWGWETSPDATAAAPISSY